MCGFAFSHLRNVAQTNPVNSQQDLAEALTTAPLANLLQMQRRPTTARKNLFEYLNVQLPALFRPLFRLALAYQTCTFLALCCSCFSFSNGMPIRTSFSCSLH